MQRQTIVLLTFGATREHEQADQISVLRHDLGLLVLETRRHAHIDIARCELATAAMAHDADVAVFIDSDSLFDPLDVERLANVARETRGVVGVPYSQRKMGAGMVGGFSPDIAEVGFYEAGGLYPATGNVGMGFTAIHRDAFELLHQLPEYAERRSAGGIIRPYFEKRVVEGYWLHEDSSFCHMVRTQGGRTDLDTRIRVTHVGTHGFSIEDCLRKPEPPNPNLRVKIRAK